MSGWTVPGYTETKTIGAGGFGAVVLAGHDATGTPVAIKYLRPGLLADPEFAELFRAEAVLLSAVDSPYVVRLYEYVESPDGAAIVMELVDGVSLHEMVARQGKTTAEAALVVLYGSLLGLAAAHARGVVHRDFKPANVLVNAYGASKLTDFGISARTGSTTVPAGSLSYAPPEQFDGGPATPASDVYAATATFYECLTGQPPFRGTTRDELIAAHRTVPVPLEPVPEALRPLVAAGMAKDPGQRPASAAALAAQLRAAAEGTYGPEWAERGRSGLGAAALALAALWPTGGAPAVHGFTAEQVQLSRGQQAAGNQHAAGQHVTQGGQHNLHQWHVLHREHVAHLRHLRWLRTATATVTAAAVVAAVAVVAYTSRGPSGPGTPAHPAVAAYQAPLAASPSVSPSVAPGDYPINRQISEVGPFTQTLTDIRVLASGQAEFFVVYTNTGSTTSQLSCVGYTNPAISALTLSNGQTIDSIATYCSQHLAQPNINVGPGQSHVSYAIFPDSRQLTQPFSFAWQAGNASGQLNGLQLPS